MGGPAPPCTWAGTTSMVGCEMINRVCMLVGVCNRAAKRGYDCKQQRSGQGHHRYKPPPLLSIVANVVLGLYVRIKLWFAAASGVC